jgi:4-alpha-glucanotransferase
VLLLHIKYCILAALNYRTLANDKLLAAKTPAQNPAIPATAKEKAVKKSPKNQAVNGVVTTKTPVLKKANAIKTTPKKKEPAAKKLRKKTVEVLVKPLEITTGLKIRFLLKFHTEYGQTLFISGNHELFGNGDIEKAIPLNYLDSGAWYVDIDFTNQPVPDTDITYNYVLKNADGTISYDWGEDKKVNPSGFKSKTITIIDAWNFAGYYENSFYTEPFKNVLLKNNHTEVNTTVPKKITHTFNVKTPLLSKGQTVCLLGYGKTFGNWNQEKPVLLNRKKHENYYSINLDLSKESFPVVYKYGIYDAENNKFIRFEDGENRALYDDIASGKQTIVNDGFVVLPNNSWKGAGVAVPVFSLRSNDSFGTGEFTDLKLLVDWSKKVGLKLIQILPINDTTATHTWTDSYPYAAISAFALHPMYLNLKVITDASNQHLIDALEEQRTVLNNLEAIDYEAVINTKLNFVKEIYPLQKEATFKSKDYQQYFNQNKHWLVPYSVFCYLRDEYQTSDFNQWPAYQKVTVEDIAKLSDETSASFDAIAINYFMQYHLHLQLKAATEYAHVNGIIVKGDIAIGVYRFGADAWQRPDLFHMNMQAGAPPDDFAVKGQNWGFPTYNWQAMMADGFAWWKQRFEQMSYYFDAFRIDHILGFFRIWSIPMHAVEGILGYFVPSIPVHINEFNGKGIWFDYHRYTKPFITDDVLLETFGYDNNYVKETFLNYNGFGSYTLKPEVATQRKVVQYLSSWNEDAFTAKIKQGLFDLISNVILFEVEGSQAQQYHFRFSMDTTSSFKHLDNHTQNQLQELYVNYFFSRQDSFWMKEALQKLPALKRVTNMLVCGEDLGLVPSCVPEVMRQLGLLSLEIQRMPKDPKKEFFHPNDAPYLSVVTPSTHDMSTIRGWWEEDKDRIQKFYNNELGQYGAAPFYCEAWINKAIVVQHLFSPAMWCVFQLQDLFGADAALRKADPNSERINVPANPKHYWRYRMHLTLEKLLGQSEFNNELKSNIVAGGR